MLGISEEDMEYINAMRKSNGLTTPVTAEDKAGILDAMKLHGVNTVEALLAAEDIIYNTWDVDEELTKRKAIEAAHAKQVERLKKEREQKQEMMEARLSTPAIIPKGEPNGVIPIVIEYEGRQYKLID